ncbi:hypothetical protein FSB08_12805 [Paraburkholderia sp. JPY432]|nr:hypothetical protein [Paraburkholderia youngii]
MTTACRKTLQAAVKYFSCHSIKQRVNPARQGHPDPESPVHPTTRPELTVHPDGTGTVKKHYCLGRISHELIQVPRSIRSYARTTGTASARRSAI